VQERYGISREEAQRQADLWSKELEEEADRQSRAARM
jgi:hypothetical protein